MRKLRNCYEIKQYIYYLNNPEICLKNLMSYRNGEKKPRRNDAFLVKFPKLITDEYTIKRWLKDKWGI